MFLQLNTPDNYASFQQLATQIAILSGRLSMMRLDHPERDALATEFATLQAQLTVAQDGVQQFRQPGFTF